MSTHSTSTNPFVAGTGDESPNAANPGGRLRLDMFSSESPQSGGPEGPDPDWKKIALTASGAVFLVALLFSAVLQGGGLAFLLHFVPPAPRSDDSNRLAERYVTFRQQEEVIPEPVEELADEQIIDESKSAPPEPEPEPEPEEQIIDEEPEEIVELPPEEPPSEQPAETGFAVETYGAEGGGGPAIRTGNARPGDEVAETQPETRQERREERREERQQEERRGPVRMEDTSVPPRPVSTSPSLGYPSALRERGIEGRVVLQCIITETGRVVSCRQRSGPDELGRYAISIVRQWRFSPGKDHADRAVPVVYTFQLPFRLRTD